MLRWGSGHLRGLSSWWAPFSSAAQASAFSPCHHWAAVENHCSSHLMVALDSPSDAQCLHFKIQDPIFLVSPFSWEQKRKDRNLGFESVYDRDLGGNVIQLYDSNSHSLIKRKEEKLSSLSPPSVWGHGTRSTDGNPFPGPSGAPRLSMGLFRALGRKQPISS